MAKKNATTRPARRTTTELATEVDGKTPKASKAAQLRKYKERYEPYVGPNGVSLDNGDDVATLLRGASPDTVVRAAEIVKGLDKGTLAKRYAERNPGARRMNSGNIIRAAVRRGDLTVTALRKTLKTANADVNTAS